jgi:septation ring formation regulator EzrA
MNLEEILLSFILLILAIMIFVVTCVIFKEKRSKEITNASDKKND